MLCGKTDCLKKLSPYRVPIAFIASAATPALLIAFIQFASQIPDFLTGNFGYNPREINIYAFAALYLLNAFISAFNLGLLTFIIAGMHALFLGLPAYWVTKTFDLTQWWVSLVCGFFIGCIPAAIYSWPVTTPGYSYREWNGEKMVDLVINGAPTAEGWHSYIYSACGMGGIGMVSGFVAWLVWWHLRPQENSHG